MIILVGLLGLGVYWASIYGKLGALDPVTLSTLYHKILLPIMIFCSFAGNDHIAEYIGWDTACLYAIILWAMYGLVYSGMGCFGSLSVQRAHFTMQLCSNNLMLVAAPMVGLFFGMEAIPVVVLATVAQLLLLIVSISFEDKYRLHALEVISRYYQQLLPMWCALIAGLLASYLPWKAEVLEFFSDTFDWMCLFNILFSVLVMSIKTCSIQHSIKDAGYFFLSKTFILFGIIGALYFYDMIDSTTTVFLGTMFIVPGIMIKDYAAVHEYDTSIYWKQKIAGCNIWYMYTLLFIGLLPMLWVV